MAMDNVSFDTSSHPSLDFLLETRSVKSYTFGFGRRYPYHIRQPRPKKRTLSAASFNWNLLVDRIDDRLQKEAERKAKLKSSVPMVKLTEILGSGLLERIKNEMQELYEKLMEHIANKQPITYAFCRMLLCNYNINLDQERKLQRLRASRAFNDDDTHSDLNNTYGDHSKERLNDGMDRGDADYSDLMTGGRRKGGKGGNKKKDEKGFGFIEWNFQKRNAMQKKLRQRKDHPSFPIVQRILERYNAGKDIKDLMPVKGAFRVIYQVYSKKAEELKQLRSQSPDANLPQQESLATADNNTFSKKVSTLSPKQSTLFKGKTSGIITPDGSQHNTV